MTQVDQPKIPTDRAELAEWLAVDTQGSPAKSKHEIFKRVMQVRCQIPWTYIINPREAARMDIEACRLDSSLITFAVTRFQKDFVELAQRCYAAEDDNTFIFDLKRKIVDIAFRLAGFKDAPISGDNMEVSMSQINSATEHSHKHCFDTEDDRKVLGNLSNGRTYEIVDMNVGFANLKDETCMTSAWTKIS